MATSDGAAANESAMTGCVALVTGASRGIGLSIAQRFARAGAAVAVSARTVEPGESRFEGSLTETVASIAGRGGTAIAVVADLGVPDDRPRLVEEVTAQLGPIDVLVNNAAVTWFAPVETFDLHRYDLMFDVQVKAPFELAQLVLPSMRERGRGWILNISSGAARHPQGPPYERRLQGGAVYGMCKAALERFTTGLASEVYDNGIAVNVLSPAGIVPTPGVVHHKLIRPGMEAFVEPPEVIAEAAFALCSGDPAALTGRVAYSRPLLDELGIDVPQ
jgi:NAD(P)-dependent dehydrogenase (short-subunit alcohol dehydrogenase family)